MSGEDFSGYPEHLAAEAAPPPEPVTARLFGMALRAHEQAQEDEGAEELFTVAPWRKAAAVETLLAEFDAAAPKRNRASDGTIGNAAHAILGKGSDHNPWLIYQGKGIVRAADITNDPAIRLPEWFERFRAAAAAGKLPQVLVGGYLILNGRITAADFTGWRRYTGPNPHVAHGHVSVGLNPVQFDSRASWGVYSPPAPPRAGWTGPDLTGDGPGLRGAQGDNGDRVAGLQWFLAVNYPGYGDQLGALDRDGWWGEVTTAWLAEFAHRSGIPEADGANIGPKLAAALYRAGLGRRLSAARQRAAGHITRTARR